MGPLFSTVKEYQVGTDIYHYKKRGVVLINVTVLLLVNDVEEGKRQVSMFKEQKKEVEFFIFVIEEQ